jgi:hypothetical protein
MREQTMKLWLCGLLVGSHLLVISTAIVLNMVHALLPEEMSACLTLLGPTFTIYTAAVLRFITKRDGRRSSGKKVSRPVAVISFAYPAFFLIATLAILFAKAFNYAFTSLEQFRVMLSVVQGAFGLFGAQIIASLFDLPQGKAGAAPEP